MTEQMAVEKLRFLPTPMFDNEADEAKRMAIKALEKQIPKKPKCFDDFEAFECPNCGGMIMALDDMSTHKHCLLCGQKLNWEEV